ncbi:uncharacterized protein J3D65DRAFT_599610 [Phyllosticta citribraziliensis]|uniref:Uncharacterized protein n=1 Tax=Phyllosticta citribraziliensis TaxID=989973 RepID=A0ABR1MCT4_9PEZI
MRIPLLNPLLPLLLVFLLSTTPPGALASKWYDVHFATTPHPEPVQFFVELSGQMVIPPLRSPGAYYIFPGLQPRYGGGIYQNVLDGNKGHWSFASGWCCFKGWGWGGGFNVYAGETVSFNNKWTHAGDERAWWTTTIRHDSTGTTRTNSWPLGGKFFNQALFAIEVYGKAWDFGWLEFRNVVIISNGRDTSWCKPVTDTTIYYIENIQARVTPKGVICSIGKLILKGPKPGRYPPREKE